VGKQYRIGQYRSRYNTLRDKIGTFFPGSKNQKRADPGSTENQFWALRNVSFSVAEGEVVGVIGRNGAGKSTLLKLMSRITYPTEGRIEVHGRIGSLLEVGTGFHPELSGRENIFMSGAILGMSNAEISRKFDAMVEFAEVEKFVDTPVKHYSSGMYLRLAFAVAAHLEPEILIVDEVLAVGDAAFQKKCLGKMDEVSKQGRTVLFVSHNMVAVENLCTRGIFLRDGRVVFDGSAHEAIDMYLTPNEQLRVQDLSQARRAGTGEVRISRYEIISSNGKLIRAGEAFTIRCYFEVQQRVTRPHFSISIFSRSGVILFSVFTSDLGYEIPELSADGYIDLHISQPNLLAGVYPLHLGVSHESTNHWYDRVYEGPELEVEPSDVYGTGRQRAASYSFLFYDCAWSLVTDPADTTGISAEPGIILEEVQEV
jgi:lipopolysaccharide transport system ATP-binding protein